MGIIERHRAIRTFNECVLKGNKSKDEVQSYIEYLKESLKDIEFKIQAELAHSRVDRNIPFLSDCFSNRCYIRTSISLLQTEL